MGRQADHEQAHSPRTPDDAAARDLPSADMYEAPEELTQRWPLIAPLLTECRTLNTAWKTWDATAADLKRTHSVIVLIAAIFGTGAVLLAIWQLAVGENTPFLYAQLEFMMAGITLIAVAAGIFAELDQRWILERCRAEQCRFVKFAFMRQASYWLARTPASRAEFLNKCLAELRGMTKPSTRQYVRNELDLSFEDELPYDAPSGSSDLVGQLRDFWLRKRIQPQAEFFHRRAAALSKIGSTSRRMMPLLFFLSLIAAGVHFAIDAYQHSNKQKHVITPPPALPDTAQAPQLAARHEPATNEHDGGLASKVPERTVRWWALLAAATLPVVAMGLRSVRSAFEFDRNENRFHGLYRRLNTLADRLPPGVTAQQFSRVSAATEQTLRDEHRSWVRLMVEAEWF